MSLMELAAKLSLDTSAYEKSMNSAQNMAKGFGNGLATAAKAGLAAVGGAATAVVGFAGSSVKAGMSFDSSMSQVAATLGKSMSDLEGQVGTVDTAFGTFNGNLREFAQFMGKNTAFSATQAADALNYMALAGYDAQTSMDMLPNVLNLAAAGNFDLARASDMVTDTQTAFGISLERTALLVDEMAKAASTGNTSVEQLGDAFLTVGGLANELNGGFVTLADGTKAPVDGIQELEIALTAMANAGIKGSEAGTHMRNMITKLSSPTKEGVAALEGLGVAVFDSEGNMRSLHDVIGDLSFALGGLTQEAKIQTISDLFNARDLTSAKALLAAVGDASGTVAEKLREAGISTDGFRNSMLNANGEVMSADEAMDTLASSMIALSKNGKSNAEIQEILQNGYHLTAEEAEAAVNAMTTGVAEAGSMWDSIGESILDAEGAAQKMADTQLDNLAGDVTIFKSALEGAQIAISDSLSPALRDFVQFGTDGLSRLTTAFTDGGIDEAMKVFGEVLADGISMVTGMLPDAINAGMQLLGAVGQGIIDNLPQIVDAAVQIVVQLAKGLVTALPQLAHGAITLVQSLGTALMDNSETLLNTGTELLTMLWNGITTGLPMLAENGAEILRTLGESIGENLPQLLDVGLNALMDFSGSLRENVGMLVDAGIDMLLSIADGLIAGLPTMIETIPTIISNIAGLINDNAPKLIAGGIELIMKLLGGIIEAVPTLIAEFPKIIKAIFDVITAINWLALGANIITWIKNGIQSLSTAVPDLIHNIGNKAADFIKNINWSGVGSTIVNFIKNGISALGQGIPTLLSNIGQTALNLFRSIDWVGLGKSVLTFIGNGISSLLQSIPDLLRQAGELGLNAIRNFDWLGVGSGIINGIISGLSNGVGALVDSVRNAASRALDAAKNFLGIHSPSRVFRDQVGKMMSAGLGVGFEEGMPVNDMVNSVEDAFKAVESLNAPVIKPEAGELLSGGLKAGLDTLKPATSASGKDSGGITVNVYAHDGQTGRDIAREVERILTRWDEQRRKAWA